MTFQLSIQDIEMIISKISNDSDFEEILQNLNEIRNGMFLVNRDTVYLKCRE